MDRETYLYQNLEKSNGESALSFANDTTSLSDKKSIHDIIQENSPSPIKGFERMFKENGNNIELLEEDGDKLLIPEKFIREEEQRKITFSMNGIVKFIEDINAEGEDKWTPLYNKDNLILHYKKGSALNSNFLLGRIQYKLQKSLFSRPIDFDLISKVMYSPEYRMKYDSSLKEFKVHEQGDNYFVFRQAYHKPIFFISERDCIDKRISFTKDGVYYTIATSVENYIPQQDGVVRIVTILNSLTITEDVENFYFHGYNQLDAKTSIPERILNITIPTKTIEWYNNFIKEIQSIISKE